MDKRFLKCLKRLGLLFPVYLMLLLLGSPPLKAQQSTVVYITRDTLPLKMDIYLPAAHASNNSCVIFAFGGGFFTGTRDAKNYLDYFKSLTDSGYVVASIDYRLGLKNSRKPPSIFNKKPLINSIEMAVEDFYAATSYLLQHASEYHIDGSKFIASGSSAGAITALTADYQKRNSYGTKILPDSFQYAGVISFAGGIYSSHGHPKYAMHPAPMLLFHGKKDKVVPFKKKSLFGTGLYGSSVIIRHFKEINAPYCLLIFENTGHAAASFPMEENLPQIHAFLREYIRKSRPLFIEATILNNERTYKKLDFKKAFENKSNR